VHAEIVSNRFAWLALQIAGVVVPGTALGAAVAFLAR
jgi:hypothetical protein